MVTPTITLPTPPLAGQTGHITHHNALHALYDLADSAGQILVSAGADAWTMENLSDRALDSAVVHNALVDAKGDLLTATANDTPARLAVGANGSQLIAASSTATGLAWLAAPWVNVKDPQFGAIGDGVTDDTAAIHLARDSGADVLNFPDGTYLVTGLTANIASQNWRLSPKAIIKLKNSSNTDVIVVSATGVIIEGGIIDGNRANQTGGRGVFVSDAVDVTIRNVYVHDSKSYGIYGLRADRLRVFDCTVVDSESIGIFLATSSGAASDMVGCLIRGNRIDRSALGIGIAGGGIQIHGASPRYVLQTRIQNNHIFLPTSPTSTGAICIEVWGGSTQSVILGNVCIAGAMGISVDNSDYSSITGNVAFGPSTYGFELAASSRCSLIGNTVNGNALTLRGLSISQLAASNTVEGNSFQNLGSGGTGIHLSISSAVSAVRNAFIGNRITINGASSKGIWVQTNNASAVCSGTSIIGNNIEGDLSASSNGVYLNVSAGTISRAQVVGNLFTTLALGINQNGDDLTLYAANQFDSNTATYGGSGTNIRQAEPTTNAWVASVSTIDSSGRFRGGAGLVGGPTFSFTGDADTGIFTGGSNTLDLAIGAAIGAELSAPADGETALLVRRNVAAAFTLQRVSMGIADSGGAGFKVLRVPN